MAKGFSIMDMMSEISREDAAVIEKIEKVSVFDIKPNEENFYESSSMEQLKNSIFAMGGVRQNILLVKLPEVLPVSYKIIAGHRRVRACMELVQEGHPEFEHIPAVIMESIDKDTEKMLLVMTNSTQRELTDWEKVMQHMQLKEIIPKLKKRQGLDGRARTLEADYLGVSEAQIAIYNTIGTKLDVWLMSIFKDGSIGISLAYEAAKLEPEEQRQLVQISTVNGRFTEEDIKRLTGSRPIKGQERIQENIVKNVSESDTFEEAPKLIKENVSESDTFKETPKSVKENVSESSTFEEAPKLIKENVSESDTFKETPKSVKENVSESSTFEEAPELIKENVSESDTSEEAPKIVKENVSESDTSEIYMAVEKRQLRGGYELDMIDELVLQFESYLQIAKPEKMDYHVAKYSCLLDALYLLKERMASEEQQKGVKV